MKPEDYIIAARVPATLSPQEFGLWTIQRLDAGAVNIKVREKAYPIECIGFPSYTLLRRYTDATIHLPFGEIVMEDSAIELMRHLPIWMVARGRVLKTGLGLGCVVRGLLAKPEVDHITVVEIDADIIRVIGAEFAKNPRVEIIQADALTWDFGDRQWDFAWHDIWTEGNQGLQTKHALLMQRYKIRDQGAWAFPRYVHRLISQKHGRRLIGGPRPKVARVG